MRNGEKGGEFYKSNTEREDGMVKGANETMQEMSKEIKNDQLDRGQETIKHVTDVVTAKPELREEVDVDTEEVVKKEVKETEREKDGKKEEITKKYETKLNTAEKLHTLANEATTKFGYAAQKREMGDKKFNPDQIRAEIAKNSNNPDWKNN